MFSWFVISSSMCINMFGASTIRVWYKNAWEYPAPIITSFIGNRKRCDMLLTYTSSIVKLSNSRLLSVAQLGGDCVSLLNTIAGICSTSFFGAALPPLVVVDDDDKKPLSSWSVSNAHRSTRVSSHRKGIQNPPAPMEQVVGCKG